MKKIKKDITEVVDSYLCHSCGSCFSSCGHDCISYNKTTAGFYFPKIDYDACTNCGLCFDVCPGDHFSTKLKEKKNENDPFIGKIISSSAGKTLDKEIYLNSQSGGITTAIIKFLLDKKIVEAAVVTEMADSSMMTKAKLITNSDDLYNSQKSKYVPTTLNSIVPEILKIEGKVALVGLPCHMHGLENLTNLKRKLREKIIKVGLICDRVMLYSSIDFFKNQITEKTIENFVFRDSTNTGYPGDISFNYNDKFHVLDKKYRKNMKDFFTPTRCMLCFDKMNIYSDIVLGDPHGIEGINRVNGESLVLTRTQVGEDIVNEMLKSELIKLKNVSIDDAISGQGIELKKKKFHANISAWKELEIGNTPDYPNEVYEYLNPVSRDDIKSAKDRLLHSIKLDKLKTSKEVLHQANNYFLKKTKKKTFLSKIINLIKGK